VGCPVCYLELPLHLSPYFLLPKCPTPATLVHVYPGIAHEVTDLVSSHMTLVLQMHRVIGGMAASKKISRDSPES
jgi:hypothetical protein